ncbi:prepilin-type N-terminal cleavage/methylation domain-containing protein [Clostridium fungisolvens]|uniref:Prepilin-type N-terminal cleavage/methylation domain-containing protein n=1 Tax=Clostridium fungisolvens TaxID=1604897 RepID=A0A6V8SQT7_9CLOT|nr:prepilin-type N-terminal cleavage/methylation domain-containing protein [Clostridium fungisolvens]GFP77568.1 hypothetical protein bsdtw1_03726 [Clostridium fungisolvens]
MSNALTSRLKKKKKGFTLIELIIVIAIIAILAAIAIPSFTQIREKSKVKVDEASSDTIKKAVITLLTDGTIKQDSATDGTFDISVDASGTVQVSTPVGLTSGSATTIASYFKDIKSPQESGKTKFNVKISHTDETVTVVATN